MGSTPVAATPSSKPVPGNGVGKTANSNGHPFASRSPQDLNEELEHLLEVVHAVKRGNFGVRFPTSGSTLATKIGAAFNDIIEMNENLSDELARVSQLVCQEGRMTERAETQIRAALREKETLLKEVHHRVKNNLQVISSLLSLQSDGISDPGVMRAFNDSRSRIRSMALAHESLYASEDLSCIDMSAYVRRLTKELMSAHNRDGRVKLELELDPLTLVIDRAVPCGLILNELVSNAFKHAFPSGNTGEIHIKLRGLADGHALLSVSDTGVGLPNGCNPQTAQSLGLRLVSVLSEQLSAKLDYQNGIGTCFCLRFPREADRKPMDEPETSTCTT